MAESLRSEVTNALSKAQPPKQNITKHDKHKAAVIMDVDSYREKIRIMFQNTRVYEKLKKVPTGKYKEGVVSFIRVQGTGDNHPPAVLRPVSDIHHGPIAVWLA